MTQRPPDEMFVSFLPTFLVHYIHYKHFALLAKGSKSVLFLSDMHVGSAYAVCSKHPTIGDTGGEWKPNRLQRKLYNTWLWVKDSLLEKRPTILCLNGEPIDGANSKQVGQQSWSTNINDQLNDAERLLKEFNYDNFVMTRGSGYHIQKEATNYEETLGIRMGSVPYSGYFYGINNVDDYDNNRNRITRTDYFINFSLNTRVFNVTHHIAFTRWESYKPTALSRELANIEYLRGRYWHTKDHPTFIVRSHVHYFVLIRFSSQCGFTTPAWKFPDAHLFRAGLSGTAPSIGAIEVLIEPNGAWSVEPHILDNDKYPKHEILRF